MKCVLLVAGHQHLLDREIKADESGRYAHLEGVPKALMPSIAGKKILDHWWDLIKYRQLFSEVFLVTNGDKFRHFERWASASDFPLENIVNDGTTSNDTRLGAVADLALCLRVKRVKDEDVLVIAGDMMFQDDKFDMNQLLNFLYSKSDGDVAIFYELESWENPSTRGVVEVCPFSNKILKFFEKPQSKETSSRKASVGFYLFRASTLPYVQSYLSKFPTVDDRTLGKFMSWLINNEGRLVYGLKLPTGFQLIGETSLKDYEAFLKYFQERVRSDPNKKRITRRAYARVGLMGNPSDGFFGKTISMSIKNFWAEVTICESNKLILMPHPLYDPTEFGSLADLHGISCKDGYLGGLRLLQATCKKFYHFCSTRGIALARRNFSLRYNTNIPRQVGLAGSSAIVTATLRCLMEFFRLSYKDIPKEIMPQFILDVEVSELFINAGLQDRVIQVYEGIVYMDFSKSIMTSQGFGSYEPLLLEADALPQFFLCYLSDPSDSGKIHSNVRARFEANDLEIIEAMRKFADLTVRSKEAIVGGNWDAFSEMMSENFKLRRSIYGDECIGDKNLRMVEIGNKFGAACKFPGSGGAVVGLLHPHDEVKFEAMRQAYEDEGFVFSKIIPNLH